MSLPETVKALPKLPGVYVFKNKDNEMIYVGKAKNLYKRVSSYFAKQKSDWKIQELIKEHDIIEHIITKSETEAYLLEAQLIGKVKPKYNVLLKNGNPFIYIVITDEEMPKLKLENKKKNKGIYFGPFLKKSKVRYVYEYLLRTLKLRLCNSKIDQGCLDYHLGRCIGNCKNSFDLESYKLRLNLAKELLNENYDNCKKILENQIKEFNANLEFEKSKHLHEYLQNIEFIFDTLKARFSENKYLKDFTIISTPQQYKIENPLRALDDLQILLKLKSRPISIDCFDISHFQSRYLVGSCIRFTHGIPEKNKFRRFKIRTLDEQNDYAALQEIVLRRYRDKKELPDVVLIDGGKGQLNAVKNLFDVTCISLAKKEEILFTAKNQDGIKLNIESNLGQLLIAIRDYAHHFAISYHKKLRNKSIV